MPTIQRTLCGLSLWQHPSPNNEIPTAAVAARLDGAPLLTPSVERCKGAACEPPTSMSRGLISMGHAAQNMLKQCCWPQARPTTRRRHDGWRDFKLYPVLVDRPLPEALYAVSDIHGQYDKLVALLTRYNLAANAHLGPTKASWCGANACLVVDGDLIDKGPKSIEIIELLMNLQAQARRADAGGEVVVLMGNHEAEFLADPHNAKASGADGIGVELEQRALDPDTFASDADRRGFWLRRLPLGARFGDWFFCHAGNSQGKNFQKLSHLLQKSIQYTGFRGDDIIGDDSILEARRWWENDIKAPRHNADALGVSHIVFGHERSVLGPETDLGLSADALLVRIDCGMPQPREPGRMLRVRSVSTGQQVAESLGADGTCRVRWSEPSLQEDDGKQPSLKWAPGF